MANAKTSKYQSIISKTKEVKDSEAIENNVEEARIQIDADILQSKREVAIATKRVEQAIERTPFNSSYIIEAQENLELNKAHYDALVALKADLF